MAALIEKEVRCDIVQVFDGEQHIGTAAKAGKKWMWTFVSAQRFGFKGDKAQALKKIRNLYFGAGSA